MYKAGISSILQNASEKKKARVRIAMGWVFLCQWTNFIWNWGQNAISKLRNPPAGQELSLPTFFF